MTVACHRSNEHLTLTSILAGGRDTIRPLVVSFTSLLMDVGSYRS